MIHWLWLIPAVMIGGLFGIALVAMCDAAKDDD